MITKLARMLAARTLVVWLEMTTAPETITSDSAVVSKMTRPRSSSDGAQPRLSLKAVRYTPKPR